jgi:hypothetical protein
MRFPAEVAEFSKMPSNKDTADDRFSGRINTEIIQTTELF